MSNPGGRGTAALALARVTDVLVPAGVREPRWEPRYYRGARRGPGGRLWSRNDQDLTRYFPDLVPALAEQLPPDVMLDRELVAFDTTHGRLDFAALGRQLAAGRQLAWSPAPGRRSWRRSTCWPPAAETCAASCWPSAGDDSRSCSPQQEAVHRLGADQPTDGVTAGRCHQDVVHGRSRTRSAAPPSSSPDCPTAAGRRGRQ